MTTKDLISRQDAIDAIERMWADEWDECDIDFNSGLRTALCEIKALPSADRPTGEWVRLEREEKVYDLYGVPTWGVNYMCDKCGFIKTAIQDHFAQYKWCPSCGADMRRGGDDE